MDRFGYELVTLNGDDFDALGMYSGSSLLHRVEDGETVTMLIECLREEVRESHIFKLSQWDHTALHTACFTGRIEVVQALLSLDIDVDRFLFISKTYGTALHTAATKEIAEFLVNAVSEEKRITFVLTLNGIGETVLHSTHRPDVIEYLLGLETRVPVKTVPYRYICANSGFIDANETVPVNRLMLTMVENSSKNTPLLSAISKGNASTTAAILRCIVQNGIDLQSFLHYKNAENKNAFNITKQLHDDKPTELMSIITEYQNLAGLTSGDLTLDNKDEMRDSTEIPLSHATLGASYMQDKIKTLLTSNRSWSQLTSGEVGKILPACSP